VNNHRPSLEPRSCHRLQNDEKGTEGIAVVMLQRSARLPLLAALAASGCGSGGSGGGSSGDGGSGAAAAVMGRLAPLRCGGGPRCVPVLPEEAELAQQVGAVPAVAWAQLRTASCL
jgi:hypothetical protein